MTYKHRILKTTKGFDMHILTQIKDNIIYQLSFCDGKIKSRVKKKLSIGNKDDNSTYILTKEDYDSKIEELLTNYKFL
jgi:hypothetical protein